MELFKEACLGAPQLHIEVDKSGYTDDSRHIFRVTIEEIDSTKPADSRRRTLGAEEITELIDDGLKFRALKKAEQIKKEMVS